MSGRTFPVQGWGPIPWEIGHEAWVAYHAKYPNHQTCERIAERGGFHDSEMDEFVPGWRERVSQFSAALDLLEEWNRFWREQPADSGDPLPRTAPPLEKTRALLLAAGRSLTWPGSTP